MFRESDIIGRLGGDEFVALLADAQPDMHATIRERVERGVAQHNKTSGNSPWPSQLSIGISFFDPKCPLSVPELIIAADHAMYADKRERRERP